jgi:predicted DNA-binding protein
MAGKAKVRRVRVYTRLSAELRDRLSGYCAASSIAERAVFEEAIQQYVDRVGDLALVLRRLDRLGRAGARLHRDVELLSEAFAVFVRLWFAHTPTIPEDGKAGARSTAESRYRLFVEHVGQQFSGGRRFLDDLPRESIAHDAELDAVAGQSPNSATGTA